MGRGSLAQFENFPGPRLAGGSPSANAAAKFKVHQPGPHCRRSYGTPRFARQLFFEGLRLDGRGLFRVDEAGKTEPSTRLAALDLLILLADRQGELVPNLPRFARLRARATNAARWHEIDGGVSHRQVNRPRCVNWLTHPQGSADYWYGHSGRGQGASGRGEAMPEPTHGVRAYREPSLTWVNRLQ